MKRNLHQIQFSSLRIVKDFKEEVMFLIFMKWQWEEEGGDGVTKLGGWNEIYIKCIFMFLELLKVLKGKFLS